MLNYWYKPNRTEGHPMFTVITEGNLSDEQVATEFTTRAEADAYASAQDWAVIEHNGITLRAA